MKSINKRYGKRKWIDTPFSKPYKASLAAHRMTSSIQIASALMLGISQSHAINSAQGNSIMKAASIAASTVNAMKAVSEQMKQSKFKTNEIKTKWGVK